MFGVDPARPSDAPSPTADGQPTKSRIRVSPIDVILLGLLSEEPRNGYEINKVIKQRRLRSWVKISEASVYRRLRALADDGALSGYTTRDGQNPHKTVFKLTPAGRARLAQSVADAARQPIHLQFDFDVWLAHLGLVPQAERAACLASLGAQLEATRAETQAMLDVEHPDMPTEVRALMDLRSRVLDVTSQWLAELPDAADDQPASVDADGATAADAVLAASPGRGDG